MHNGCGTLRAQVCGSFTATGRLTVFETGIGLSEAAPAMNSQSLLDTGDLPLLELVSPISSDRSGAVGATPF